MSQVDPRRQYYGSIPQIAQAYQNDPRTKLSQSMIGAGTSTAPVAGGGWAVTDGLARMAQALAGTLVNKKNEKKYSEREKEYMAAMQASAALANTPQPQAANPAQANPAMINPNDAAQALAGTQPSSMGVPGNRPQPQAIEQFDPGPSAAALSGAPMAPQNAPQMAAQGQNPLPAPPVGAGARYGHQAASQPPARTPMDARSLYYGAIVPIEGGTDPKTGAFRTSFKGAVGPGQIMPGTAPEAAKLAGRQWNDKLYRTDPEYNNALGEAYLAKQLEDFGDPAKALAAYNAGPGAVRMAVRKARRSGGDWMDYLPVTRKDGKVVDTTKDYVLRGLSKMKLTEGEGGTFTENYDAVGMVQPPAPTYENVPDKPTYQAPTDMPAMPDVPPEVQSNRIAMAQQMLNSGNPDLAVMAQAYLDKGLDEQNSARMQRSQQQYGRENIGYTANVNDYFGYRSDDRQFGFNQVTDAKNANRTRETNYNQNVYAAGESAAEREQQSRRDNSDRTWRSNEAELEFGREREGAREDALLEGKDRKNLFDTVGGAKIYESITSQNNEYDSGIANLDRALDLLDKQSTGGKFVIPGTSMIAGGIDDEVGELIGIFNDATLKKLGGSLGVAISDGDRKFVENIGPNMATSTTANREKIKVLRAALARGRDFNSMRIRALSQGGAAPAELETMWRKYAEANPLASYDKDGKAIYVGKPVSFEQWLGNIPQYDAEGNLVNGPKSDGLGSRASRR